MKTLIAIALAFVSTAAFAQATPEAAQKAYDSRDYTQPGRASAAEAAKLFGELAQQAANPSLKAQYLVKQAASVFFLGESTNDNNEKIAQYTTGMNATLAALKIAGINDVNKVTDADIANIVKRSKDEVTLVAEALYVYGINLGQWGQANGVMQSLNKWPELRTTMELIVKVGAKGLHEYGAYRTLGRGYFKIPALLGGDVAKAQKYLSTAVNGSLAPGQVYSTNGYNNLFYAELLVDQGQDAQAKKLLSDFTKADPTTLLPGYEAETRQSQRLAVEMLKNL